MAGVMTFSRLGGVRGSESLLATTSSLKRIPLLKGRVQFLPNLASSSTAYPRRGRTLCVHSRMGFYSTEPLNSKSEMPVSNGATRLWISAKCPYAQRVWIAVNYKGLNDAIQIVEIDLADRPTWYKEKVYSGNKVPALEHENKVTGESLDLLQYLDAHFDGPKLTPEDQVKKDDAEDLLKHADALNKAGFGVVGGSDAAPAESLIAPELDFFEAALGKHTAEGPFFLGKFGVVDAAMAPFLERFQLLFEDIRKYDITAGRPNLKNWFKEMNKLDAYTQTKIDPQVLVTQLKTYLNRRVAEAAPEPVKATTT